MLYLCATPIGNLDDVSERLRTVLAAAHLVAAEDTRRTRKLLSRLGVHVPVVSLFAHNEAERTVQVLRVLREGRDVALVSDAGTPAVSDPGARLVAAAVAEGLSVTVVPGPSAVTAAVAAAGFVGAPGFRFVGYLPRRAKDLAAAVVDWRRHGGLVVAFEAPGRLRRSLDTLSQVVPTAPLVVCREITKMHEEYVRGTVTEVTAAIVARDAVRGEVTLVLQLGAPVAPDAADTATATARALADRGLSARDVAAALQVCLGLSHRDAQRAAREGRLPDGGHDGRRRLGP